MSASLSDNTANAGTFQYTGLSKLDKRSPKYRLLASRKTMTIEEFALFYCGIDEDAFDVNGDKSYALNSFYAPFVELIDRHAEVTYHEFSLDDVPF